MEKVIIFSAPSGSGKTTIVHELLTRYPNFEFSISATSRAPRGQERDGVDYYFLSEEEFLKRIELDAFVEWEAVYAGTHYGTLRSEVERIWNKGNIIRETTIFEILQVALMANFNNFPNTTNINMIKIIDHMM